MAFLTGAVISVMVIFNTELGEATSNSASILVNQAVGDALSDALFLEAVMITMDVSMEQFSQLYVNLPL